MRAVPSRPTNEESRSWSPSSHTGHYQRTALNRPGTSVHVGVRAVPDDLLVQRLLLIGPLWKSGEITVWRSGAAFVDLSPDLAQAIRTGRIEGGAILEGISEPASRWIATTWQGALIVDASCFDLASFSGWVEGGRLDGGEDLTLVALYPDRFNATERTNHPAGNCLGA
jgi:hypothetical protein